MTHLEFDQCDIYIYDEAPCRIVLDEGARYADLTAPELAELCAALSSQSLVASP